VNLGVAVRDAWLDLVGQVLPFGMGAGAPLGTVNAY
jgi:hypothetical protein